MKKIKIPTLKDYEKELWRVFSLYIRQRDANEKGYIRCISCGGYIPWRNSDAGHYYSRRHKSLKYNEKNVNAQCKACNIFNQGNAQGYREGLIAKYGEGVMEYLDMIKPQTSKLGKFEVKALTRHYLNLLKQNGWQIK